MSWFRPFDGLIIRDNVAPELVRPPNDAEQQSPQSDFPALSEDISAKSFSSKYEAVKPAVLAYEQVRVDGSRSQGFVGVADTVAFMSRVVLGHESVLRRRVLSIASRFASINYMSEMICLVYRQPTGVTDILDEAVRGTPILDVQDNHRVRHRVWSLSSHVSDSVAAAISGSGAYIADGHHRAAAAQASMEGDQRHILSVPVGIFDVDQVSVTAFHRQVKGPLDPGETIQLIRDGRVVVRPLECKPGVGLRNGLLHLYVGGDWYELLLPLSMEHGARSLDVTRLHKLMKNQLGKVVESKRVSFIRPSASLDVSTRKCDHQQGCLFLLAPPSLDEVLWIADRGETLEMKTTYIEPKLSSKIFLLPVGR